LVLERTIAHNVERGAEISTDEHGGYYNLRAMGYDHKAVNHSQDVWVIGNTHTNSIEGHWSQLKRSIKGTHVHVSAKHLWKYVSEFNYRRNMRASHSAMFNRLVVSLSLPRLADV
jgi:transposase